MASMRSRAAPIGSAKWVLDEREQAGQFIEQEVEEFAFSARNEFEWLNEHMAEVFSSNQFDVAEVFKTPGKLRGKTPRTARKHTPAQDRQPLTDIFSSNTPNAVGSPKNDFYKKLAPIQVAQDKENITAERSPQQPKQSPLRPLGMSEQRAVSPQKAVTPPLPPKSPLRPASERKSPSPSRVTQLKQQHETRSTGDSFVSAKEALSNRDGSIHELLDDTPGESSEPAAQSADAIAADAESVAPPSKAILPNGLQSRVSHQYSVSTTTAAGMDHVLQEAEQYSTANNEVADDMDNGQVTQSETSSPERPFLRKKSSLTFASLPAREPLSKKSVGARISHATNFEKNSSTRDSVGNRPSQAVPTSVTEKPMEDELVEQQTSISRQAAGETEASKLHSKTSTQRLHERITMLGKNNPPSNPSRASKSISASYAVPSTAQTVADEAPSQATEPVDNDDDWIAPMSQARTTQSTQQSMPGSFSTMNSNPTSLTQDTSLFDSQPVEPMEEDKPASHSAQTSYPDLKSAAASSTTPAGSPMGTRWNMDGPLSASKAKFNSFLKSAKGMFASSAAASAQAKLETLNESASRSTVHLPPTKEASPSHTSLKAVPADDTEDELQLSPPRSADRRRSSQRVKDRSAREAAADSEPEPQDVQMDDDVEPAGCDVEVDGMEPDTESASAPKKIQPQTMSKGQSKPKGLATQSGELRHPAKANKGNKVSKAVPAGKSAMSIRVPSQKTIGNFSSSVHASSDKPVPSTAKAPTLTKKGSNSSLKSGASSGNTKSTAANNARLKALDAAAKSKEREEREKQRKAEEKRERERKRAEAEEEKRKRAQEQKAAEQRREREEQEARANAQRQRREREEQDRLKTEKQQAEIQRKNELLRRQAEAAKAAKAAKSEPTQPESQQEPPRPVSRPGENLSASVRPHINPAKPKRYFQPEDDERPTRPNTAHSTTQNTSKRRKTSEEGSGDSAQPSTRPAMAPPVRPSMNRKPDVPNRFTHGYMASAASAPNGAGMMQQHKAGVSSSYASSNQPKTPHNMGELAKFSNAKIPFGENANPAATQQASSSKHAMGRPLQKTPGTAHKSSPQFPNGDNIELPEIATDSEDSDDDADFVAPDWTNSPELRALLERQQLVDPMRVFGPVGPLALEDVFRGNKERQARFRVRTSSANWSGPDRLTEEERRRDREARAALERDGGWSFRPDL